MPNDKPGPTYNNVLEVFRNEYGCHDATVRDDGALFVFPGSDGYWIRVWAWVPKGAVEEDDNAHQGSR